MDLHQLFVFTKVVEHKNFSKAADDIFLSQSTVSSHIKALEKSLNLQLFDREGRNAILTSHGERLYYWAQQLLLLKDKAILDLQQGELDFYGNIRIATSTVPSSFILPKLIQSFSEHYPHVTFHITESSSRTVADTVLKSEVDLGILGEKYENDKLCYLPIQKEKLILVTAKEIDLGNKVHISDVIQYPFIFRNSDSGTQDMVNKLLHKNGIDVDQLKVAIYTDSGKSIIQYVERGIGIAIISEMTAKTYAAAKQIRMYEIEDFHDERYFYLVYHKHKTLSLIAKLFIEKAKEMAETDL